MSDEHDARRRMILAALAGLTLTSAVVGPAAARERDQKTVARTRVVYFSRSNNTRVIAGVIQRHLGADIVEIEPATPYPADYFETVAQAKSERERGILPPLKNSVLDLTSCQTLFLGFPIWGTTVPPVVQTFLSTHNLAGKILIPFITHGGYGAGDSERVLARLAPGALRKKPWVIECDQERRITEAVTGWLDSVVDE